MTQRQTHPCVCDTEGDTKAQTDFIKYMSEHFLLEPQLHGFWGFNLKGVFAAQASYTKELVMFLIDGR